MSERYKREIEDILNEAGDLAPAPRSGLLRQLWTQAARSGLWKTVVHLARQGDDRGHRTAGRCRAAPPSHTGRPQGAMLWAALLLFILGYALFFVRPSKMGPSKSGEKRWRGQPIEYGQNSWWDRLRRRVK